MGLFGGGRGATPRGRTLIRRATLLLALLLAQLLLAAEARAVDWVPNISDAGYDPIAAGGTIIYDISVAANLAAPQTMVSLDLPADVEFIGGSGTITNCRPLGPGPVVVTCTVPAFTGEGVYRLKASVKTNKAGIVPVLVTVPDSAGGVVDSNPGNNQVPQQTTVFEGADIELTVAGPGTQASGGKVTYTFTAKNLGPYDSGRLRVSVPMPNGLSDIEPPTGCSISGANYVCIIEGLAKEASFTLPFTARVTAGDTSTITVVGTVSSIDPPDPVNGNNTATINTTVTGGSDVKNTKARAPPGLLLVGEQVTFTLAASYSGDVPFGLKITDTIPSEFTVESVTPSAGSGWNCPWTAGQLVTCALAQGTVSGHNVSLGTITIVAKVKTAGNPKNIAEISSQGPVDPDLGNNKADDGGATTEDPKVDLKARKSGPNPPFVVQGQSYTFAISSVNAGNAPFIGTMRLTDAIPVGIEITDYDALNGWTCTPAVLPASNPTAIVCERTYSAPGLRPGVSTPEVVLRAKVTATTGSVINNCATVTSPTDPTQDNTACWGITPMPPQNSADIAILKSASPASIPSGDVETFRIEVTNVAPAAPAVGVTSTGIQFEDELKQLINSNAGPTGAGLVSVSTMPGVATGLSCGTAPIGGGRRLTCNIGTLPVCTPGSDCPVVTVQVRPGGNAQTGRTNTASITDFTVADPNLANNESTASFDVTPQANIAVTKERSPQNPRVDQELTYVITASTTRDGRSAAENVTIEDMLPEGLTFLSATPSTGSCSTKPADNSTTGPTNKALICNLGTIANGTQQTVLVSVVPQLSVRALPITNSVTATTTTPGNGTANASVTDLVRDPMTDLLVNKSDSPLPLGPDPVLIGQQMVYEIRTTNLGPSATNNVIVTDTLPDEGLLYVSYVTPDGGSCTTAPPTRSFGGTLECKFDRIGSGESRNIRVIMEGDKKGTWTNIVDVTSDERKLGFDPRPLNNRDEETTTVRTLADMAVVSKQPSSSPVSLRQPFDFTILVRNNTGPGLAEADNVSVIDTPPVGMELTGVPQASFAPGTATANSCQLVNAGKSFSCSFGTVISGGEITITAPMRVVAVTSSPQTFTNTATVSTTSQDANSANNAESGSVVVQSAALAGSVFRDFNNDGTQSGADSGIAGVTMQLTGTATDGTAVSLITATAANGRYAFTGLPPGTYTVTRGAVTESGLVNGIVTPGSAGGTVNGETAITGILLTAQAATGYDFALVPGAGIAITKALLSGPTTNADGSFDASFRLTLSNPSLESLNDVVVTDRLAGVPPLFGSVAATPAEPGTYAVIAAPGGSCGGLNAGFNGSSDPRPALGVTLAPSATCTIDFSIRVKPSVPLPPVVDGARYVNQASIAGMGADSGQQVSSVSQLVPLSPDISQLVIAKVLTGYTDVDGSGSVTLDDVLAFRVTATNSGSVPLTNVEVSDSRITPDSVTCPSLQPDETCLLSGTYTVTLTDLQAGAVVNTATADSNETDPVTATVTTPVVAVIDKNTLTKTALVNTVTRGGKVPYEVVAETVPFNPARLVDVMPPGFAYVEGSAVANGVRAEPAIDGRRLSFDGLVPDKAGRIKLVLTLIATAAVNPGPAVNQAQLVNPASGEVVATARARVTILAEAVFDCGDIIGKVFDDTNRNGYQDEGEPGLPAVRVTTVHGLLVTSDAEGRFNIPCADIPDADIGSNFILKLDPRTLPTGYHLTTENPRRVRLTRGKVVKLNFGAAIARIVKLELNGRVFEAGSAALKPKWEAGLDRLIAALAPETSILRITYRGEEGALARARLRAVADDVHQRWRAAAGAYDLVIDTRILSGGGP